MVNTEYFETKAQLHNQWLVEADLLWRTSRKRLIYPPFPPFPTEEVIVARANVLLAFLSKVQTSAVPFPEITRVETQTSPTAVEITSISMVDVIQDTQYNQKNTDEDVEEVAVAENTTEQAVETINEVAPENTTANKHRPSLLRRLMGS